jgi:hypothetical protein
MAGPIALVDCNNFYASCERVFQPALRDKARYRTRSRQPAPHDGAKSISTSQIDAPGVSLISCDIFMTLR